MNKSELNVGMLVDFGGYVAEVTAITPDGIVVECEEIGEDIVPAAALKRLGRGVASDAYGDIADQYDDEPYRPVYHSGRCEDAPCCGCCG
jgi:hypothetical protein